MVLMGQNGKETFLSPEHLLIIVIIYTADVMLYNMFTNMVEETSACKQSQTFALFTHNDNNNNNFYSSLYIL